MNRSGARSHTSTNQNPAKSSNRKKYSNIRPLVDTGIGSVRKERIPPKKDKSIARDASRHIENTSTANQSRKNLNEAKSTKTVSRAEIKTKKKKDSKRAHKRAAAKQSEVKTSFLDRYEARYSSKPNSALTGGQIFKTQVYPARVGEKEKQRGQKTAGRAQNVFRVERSSSKGINRRANSFTMWETNSPLRTELSVAETTQINQERSLNLKKQNLASAHQRQSEGLQVSQNKAQTTAKQGKGPQEQESRNLFPKSSFKAAHQNSRLLDRSQASTVGRGLRTKGNSRRSGSKHSSGSGLEVADGTTGSLTQYPREYQSELMANPGARYSTLGELKEDSKQPKFSTANKAVGRSNKRVSKNYADKVGKGVVGGSKRALLARISAAAKSRENRLVESRTSSVKARSRKRSFGRGLESKGTDSSVLSRPKKSSKPKKAKYGRYLNKSEIQLRKAKQAPKKSGYKTNKTSVRESITQESTISRPGGILRQSLNRTRNSLKRKKDSSEHSISKPRSKNRTKKRESMAKNKKIREKSKPKNRSKKDEKIQIFRTYQYEASREPEEVDQNLKETSQIYNTQNQDHSILLEFPPNNLTKTLPLHNNNSESTLSDQHKSSAEPSSNQILIEHIPIQLAQNDSLAPIAKPLGNFMVHQVSESTLKGSVGSCFNRVQEMFSFDDMKEHVHLSMAFTYRHLMLMKKGFRAFTENYDRCKKVEKLKKENLKDFRRIIERKRSKMYSGDGGAGKGKRAAEVFLSTDPGVSVKPFSVYFVIFGDLVEKLKNKRLKTGFRRTLHCSLQNARLNFDKGQLRRIYSRKREEFNRLDSSSQKGTSLYGLVRKEIKVLKSPSRNKRRKSGKNRSIDSQPRSAASLSKSPQTPNPVKRHSTLRISPELKINPLAHSEHSNRSQKDLALNQAGIVTNKAPSQVEVSTNPKPPDIKVGRINRQINPNEFRNIRVKTVNSSLSSANLNHLLAGTNTQSRRSLQTAHNLPHDIISFYSPEEYLEKNKQKAYYREMMMTRNPDGGILFTNPAGIKSSKDINEMELSGLEDARRIPRTDSMLIDDKRLAARPRDSNQDSPVIIRVRTAHRGQEEGYGLIEGAEDIIENLETTNRDIGQDLQLTNTIETSEENIVFYRVDKEVLILGDSYGGSKEAEQSKRSTMRSEFYPGKAKIEQIAEEEEVGMIVRDQKINFTSTGDKEYNLAKKSIIDKILEEQDSVELSTSQQTKLAAMILERELKAKRRIFNHINVSTKKRRQRNKYAMIHIQHLLTKNIFKRFIRNLRAELKQKSEKSNNLYRKKLLKTGFKALRESNDTIRDLYRTNKSRPAPQHGYETPSTLQVSEIVKKRYKRIRKIKSTKGIKKPQNSAKMLEKRPSGTKSTHKYSSRNLQTDPKQRNRSKSKRAKKSPIGKKSKKRISNTPHNRRRAKAGAKSNEDRLNSQNLKVIKESRKRYQNAVTQNKRIKEMIVKSLRSHRKSRIDKKTESRSGERRSEISGLLGLGPISKTQGNAGGGFDSKK